MPAAADLRLHLQGDRVQNVPLAPVRSLRGRQRARAASRGCPYLLVDEAIQNADHEALRGGGVEVKWRVGARSQIPSE